MRTEKRQSESSKSHILWAALGLLAFVLALYARLLFTDRVLASGDILHYFYPYRDYAAEAFRSGRIPLWNPFIIPRRSLSGQPTGRRTLSAALAAQLASGDQADLLECGVAHLAARLGRLSVDASLGLRRSGGLRHRAGAGGQRFLRRSHRPHQPDERRSLVALAGACHRNGSADVAIVLPSFDQAHCASGHRLLWRHHSADAAGRPHPDRLHQSVCRRHLDDLAAGFGGDIQTFRSSRSCQ